jgi:hypothetical protein
MMVGVPVSNWTTPEALPKRADHKVFLDRGTYLPSGSPIINSINYGCVYGGVLQQTNACYDKPIFLGGAVLKYYAAFPGWLYQRCDDNSGYVLKAADSGCCSYDIATDTGVKVQGVPRHFLQDRAPNVAYSFRPTAPLSPVTNIALVSTSKVYLTCSYTLSYTPPPVTSPLTSMESAWSSSNPYSWSSWRTQANSGLASNNQYNDYSHSLAPGTTWYVKLRVANAYGYSPESEVFSFTTPA